MKKNKLDLELFISSFLRKGVLAAGLLMFIGWIGQINFQQNGFSNFQKYNHSSLFSTLNELITQHSWGVLTIYGGLFILILLPLIRVILTGAIFIKEKDYVMAALVGLVVTGLIISISLGIEI